MERTIKCKMTPSPKQAGALQRTAEAFAEACLIALKTATEAKTTNKIKVQHLCYRKIREKTGLSSNLAIRAIARACAAKRSASAHGREVKSFKLTSIDYDQRIFQWRERDEQVSVTSVEGRLRIPLALGDYQREALHGKKPTCARVVMDKKKRWFVHIVIQEEPHILPPDKRGLGVIGVDRGIYNIAVTSTGKFYGGRKSLHERKKALALRARLQRRGTRSAKRALKRLSGKEARRVRDLNHVVSKKVVQEACERNHAIALEDLTGIRFRRGMKVQSGKKSRTMINVWPFRQLGDFIRYKAERAGVPVIEVPARHTSHTCPRCHATGDDVKRSGPHFQCGVCGYRVAADLVAACVIAERAMPCPARAAVNQPIVASELHPHLLSYKPPTSVVGC